MLVRWFSENAARTATPIRTVEVLPPSRAGEAGWVFLAAAFVVLGMIYVYAFERSAAHTRTSSSGLLPFQVLFRDLPNDTQRMYREMQEGAGEAVRRRAQGGDWPSVESLAAAGIPPFARDVLDKAGFQWSLQRSGPFVNYLGTPARADAPAFLVLVQEPDAAPREVAVPSVVDEEHQLLPDGTLLHVTYWIGSVADLRPGIVMDPAIGGWKQIRQRSPFEEMEQQ